MFHVKHHTSVGVLFITPFSRLMLSEGVEEADHMLANMVCLRKGVMNKTPTGGSILSAFSIDNRIDGTFQYFLPHLLCPKELKHL